MIKARHAREFATALIIFSLLISITSYSRSTLRRPWRAFRLWPLPSKLHSPGPSNATLGFGAIWVLTEDASTWRVQGLLKAAELVGLRINVHLLPHPTDEEVLGHLAGDNVTDRLSFGGGGTARLNPVRLTMHHIALLEKFLQTGAETVLILEDDADFSVEIKEQMAALSLALWANSEIESDAVESEAIESAAARNYRWRADPYLKDAWDVFWLGHYGVEYADHTEMIRYDDPNALPWGQVVSEFNTYYYDQGQLNQTQQQILRPVAPMSSYALAYTRSHAKRLVVQLREDHAQHIDTTLHVYCKDLTQRCVAPVPELFHHHHVAGQKRLDDAGVLTDGKHDLDWWRDSHKYSYNIRWSARCNALQVGERVGNRTQCLPTRFDNLV